jgi:hypothetical protein
VVLYQYSPIHLHGVVLDHRDSFTFLYFSYKEIVLMLTLMKDHYNCKKVKWNNIPDFKDPKIVIEF